MKPPMCKLCGKAHWLDAEHDGEASVPDYVREMAKGALGGDAAPFVDHLSPQIVPTEDVPTPMSPAQPAVIELCKTCERRQPPLGRTECDACRKQAYRERSK